MLGDINDPDVRASMESMPHFYKKFKLLGRICRNCGKSAHHVWLVVDILHDFYLCDDCARLYMSKP